MKYAVRVEETLARTVIVEADSPEDAEDKVNRIYDNEGISLDYDDFNEYNIETLREASDFDISYFEKIEESE